MHQYAVIIKNAKVIEGPFTEERKPSLSRWESFLSLFGFRSRKEIILFDSTPFTINFWLGDDDSSRSQEDGIALSANVLTSDGEQVNAEFELSLVIDIDNFDDFLKFRSKTDSRTNIRAHDVASVFATEIVSRVIAPTVKLYTASNLWDAKDRLDERCEEALKTTLGDYGLTLDKFNAVWGITDLEKNQLREKRLEEENRIKQLELDLARTSADIRSAEQQHLHIPHVPEVILRPSRLAMIVSGASLVAALIFLLINSGRLFDEFRADRIAPPIQPIPQVEGVAPPAVAPVAAPVTTSVSVVSTVPVPLVSTAIPGPAVTEEYSLVETTDGNLDAVIPRGEVADLALVSRITIENPSDRSKSGAPGVHRELDIGPDTNVTIRKFQLGEVQPPPKNIMFLLAMDISIEGVNNTDALPSSIEFEIEKEWFDASSVTTDDVKLFRFTDGWSQLETRHIGWVLGAENKSYGKFSAETPGFSTFSVGVAYEGKPPVLPTTTPLPIFTQIPTATFTAVPSLVEPSPATTKECVNVSSPHFAGSMYNKTVGEVSFALDVAQLQCAIEGEVTLGPPFQGSGSVTAELTDSRFPFQVSGLGGDGILPPYDLLFQAIIEDDGSLSGVYFSHQLAQNGTWKLESVTSSAASSVKKLPQDPEVAQMLIPTQTAVLTSTPSSLIEESAPQKPQLSFVEGAYKTGETIQVNFSGIFGKEGEAIGLYIPNNKHSDFKGWKPTNGAKEGVVFFSAPKKAGAYEFRMFSPVGNNP